MSGYDYERPYVSQADMAVYVTYDEETKERFGATVKAAALSNIEYKLRFERLGHANRMRPAPSTGRIFAGYVVIRRLGTASQYETWMPSDVFEGLYRLQVSQAAA